VTASPEVPYVERLHLEPGDVLIYSHPGRLSRQDAESISTHLKARLWDLFGVDVPLLIFDQGGRLQVLDKAELETA
jgi:hypothetical protein